LKNLQETANTPYPDYHFSNHEAGMNLSLGYGILGDPAHTYLTNTFNIVLGFEYSYRPLPVVFYMGMNFGINRVGKEF
jgi:hypothetical protein